MPKHDEDFDVTPAGELSIRADQEGGEHILALAGELDMATAPELEATVVELCSDGAKELVLDLRGLRFMDSQGLRVLLATRELCEGHGCGFAVTRGQEAVERLFEVTNLTGVLPIAELPPTNGRSPGRAGLN
jgi:anti-anti-sigma factor